MILSMKYLTQSFPTALKSALFKVVAVLLFIAVSLVMSGCAAIGDGVAEVVSFGLIPRNELPSRK
jgi:putative exporter of polyketide antibiotics